MNNNPWRAEDLYFLSVVLNPRGMWLSPEELFKIPMPRSTLKSF